MRKIVSKYEEDKIKKRNQFIVGGVLIVVMMISVLGYAFQNYLVGNNSQNTNTTSSINYNGFNFVNQNSFWALNYSNNKLVFTYNPSQIPQQDLSNLTKTINDFSNKTLYIYSEDSNSESEIRFNMYSLTNQIIDVQSIQNINCINNSIIIQNGQNEIRQVQNCIYISGQGQTLIITIDNILFKIFGVRQ